MIEKSLILVKHDGVIKGLIGEIIKRLENIGLKIIGLKMIWADEKLASNHYKITEEWAKDVFKKTKEAYEKRGRKFGFSDPMKYGEMIQSWNINFLREGPVVAIVVEGPHTIELVRKIVGFTEPRQALPGTIRGDFSFESYQIADAKQRPVRNLVHASESNGEAEREIDLWFNEEELHSYETVHEKHIK